MKLLAALLLLSSIAAAQTVTVTGTATDSDAQAWINGSYKIQFAPNPNYPNLSQYYVTTGGTQVPLTNYTTQFSGILDASGHFSQSGIVHNDIITPSGSKWTVQVCPLATGQCGTFTQAITAGGDLSAAINAVIVAPRFNAISGTYGYNDNEAQAANASPGATYYNVIVGCQKNYNPIASTWSCPTAAGGGLPTNNPAYTGTLSGPTANFSGAVTSTTVSSSVNTELNVMAPPYNAKGDCTTDDTSAIQQALNDAGASTNGTRGPKTVFFPTPPGTCYLTGTLEYRGIPLRGMPSGTGVPQGGSIIKGKPGQDVFRASDPRSVAFGQYGAIWMKDLTIIIDDSVDSSASHPNRKFGRSFDDAAITAGSTSFTSNYGQIFCGDIGQQIDIVGAGVGGADLVTTIASVQWCNIQGGSSYYFTNTVTLAAAASTTVSNAHATIGVANYAPNQTIGAGAIVMENPDSNSAHYLASIFGGYNTPTYGLLENINIFTTSNFMNTSTGPIGQNHTVGIYFQNWAPYGLKASNVNIWRTYFGVLAVCADIQSYNGACNQDLITWDHMHIESQNPIIIYDGLFNAWRNIQTYQVNNPVFLSLRVAGEPFPSNLEFKNAEQEGPGSAPSPSGWRLTGGPFKFESMGLGGNLDGGGMDCRNCSVNGLIVGGSDNHIQGSGANNTLNRGSNNTFQFGNNGSYTLYGSIPPNSSLTVDPKRANYIAGEIDGSFIRDGNGNQVRNNGYASGDLIFFPEDWATVSGPPANIGYESASPTGRYSLVTTAFPGYFQNSTTLLYGANKTANNGQITFGPNGIVPATSGTWYIYLACNGTGNGSILSKNAAGSFQILGTVNYTCSGVSSTYNLYILRVTGLAAIGTGAVDIEVQPTVSVKIAYLQYVPDLGIANITNSSTNPAGTYALHANTTLNPTGVWTGASNDPMFVNSYVNMDNATGTLNGIGTTYNYTHSAGNTATISEIYGAYNEVDLNGTAATTLAYGQGAWAANNSTAHVTNMLGTDSEIANTTGLVDTAVGVHAQINQQNTGTITNAIGIRSQLGVNVGALTNAFGVTVNQPTTTGGGTIQHLTGVFVDTMNKGAIDNYAIRTNLGKVQFGDVAVSTNSIGVSNGTYNALFGVPTLTANRAYSIPDGAGGLPVSTSVTTTAATSDIFTLQGATSSSHCSLTATNASAATNIATTYISTKAANAITVTHTATAGMTYDLLCTPN